MSARAKNVPKKRRAPRELTGQTAAKTLATMAGYLAGVHDVLDGVRNGYDPQDPIDHNVEQAQIGIETAIMRIDQLLRMMPQDDDEKTG